MREPTNCKRLSGERVVTYGLNSALTGREVGRWVGIAVRL